MIGRSEHIFVWFLDFYWLTGSFDLVIFSRSLAWGRLPIWSDDFTVFRFPRGEVGWCSEQKATLRFSLLSSRTLCGVLGYRLCLELSFWWNVIYLCLKAPF
jgi:hypothetical protein